MRRGHERRRESEPRREPPEINGWKLYAWREFAWEFARLVNAVEALERADPARFREHPTTKKLAAIYKLTTVVIPSDPASPAFRQGNTLGPRYRHWFSAGFFERYRLFFRFRSDARVIVYAWVNDEHTLRARGARNDPYEVFRRMIDAGAPPDDWEHLLRESNALRLPGED